MNKSSITLYASYVAIVCGILIIGMRFFSEGVSNGNLLMGFLFLGIGFIGLRTYKKI